MKKTASPAPDQTSSPAPENKALPMDITVRINNLRTEGSILANASVNFAYGLRAGILLMFELFTSENRHSFAERK